MGIVYHGSKEQNLKRFDPRKSTHGTYVYATSDKTIAMHFSKRCGDDYTYDLFRNGKNEPWELVENIPGAFEKMYSNSASIYSFSDETFKDIKTGFEEVVSEVGVDVIGEEYYDNVFAEILKFEQQGLIKIYRYPNKPAKLKQDSSNILDKLINLKRKYNIDLEKNVFDRLAYLHPNLLDKINEFTKECGLDYFYRYSDLIELFKSRIERQLSNPEHE